LKPNHTGSWSKGALSSQLKRLLADNDRTMADLSRTLGISFTTISDWVNGRKYPRPENLERLANYFGVTTAQLLNLGDPDAHPAAPYLGQNTVALILSKGYTIDLQFDSAVFDFADLAGGSAPCEKYLITDCRSLDSIVLTGEAIRSAGGVNAVVEGFAENKKAPVGTDESLSEDKRYLVDKIMSLSDEEVRRLRTIVDQVLALRG